MGQSEHGLDEWLSTTPDGDALTDLAMAHPQTVLTWCDLDLPRLARVLGPSYVWQARGLAARESGDASTAARYMRRAMRFADDGGSPDRRADVRASLATTLAVLGRGTQAASLAAEATELAGPSSRPRMQMREGAVLRLLGRREEALAVLGLAIRGLRRSGDSLWEARALSNRAVVHMVLGEPYRATHDLLRARDLYAESDQGVEAATGVHNLGWAAYQAGAIPDALELLAEAADRYEEFGVAPPELFMDRCAVLLAAGLTGEALDTIQACLLGFDPAGSGHGDSRVGVHAEALLVAARTASAAGRPRPAADYAAHAARLFVRLGNERASQLARLERVRARAADGASGSRLAREAEALAIALEADRAPETSEAYLLAGRLALRTPAPHPRATSLLERASRARSHGPALARSSGWLARMLAAQADGSAGRVLTSSRAGLAVLDDHRLSLGATELRALATAHGSELVAGALRVSAARGDARGLLLWSERWRATTAQPPPVRPPDDAALVAELAELREVAAEASRPDLDATEAEALSRTQRRLEQAVLTRSRRSRGADARPGTSRRGTSRRDGSGRTFTTAALQDALDGRALVTLVDVDGVLHVVVVSGGRVRSRVAGPTAEAAREVEFARFALRALATGQTADASRVRAVGARLEGALLGAAAALVPSDAAMVLVPPTRFQATPWALLPSLADRIFTVAPSGASWLRARATRAPAGHRVVLVRGPGLDSDGAEVPLLARSHPGATVLGAGLVDGPATAVAALGAFEGAWLAHVAAHGSYRQDNPMFSALHLDDGPLTVHDLERLRRTPYRLVLSACDVGLGASVGADELLGLVTALLALGSAGVVASVLPVQDAVVVDLSVRLHERILAGDDLPEALLAVRRATAGDALARATADAFLAFGAR